MVIIVPTVKRSRSAVSNEQIWRFAECTTPFNRPSTNRAPYWGILALGRFCTDLATLRQYYYDPGPILQNGERYLLLT